MIFNSLAYILFLIIFVASYWLLPKGISRLLLILVFSSIFYGFWRPEFLLIMALSTSLDYFIALRIEKTSNPKSRNILLGISLAGNLSVLLYFKYLYFLIDNSTYVLSIFGFHPDIRLPIIILPLGISFYTFEAISYVVDVYRKIIPAEKNIARYASFILFFPKLIAGPVLRAGEMLPQLSSKNIFYSNQFISGIERILFGLFLKTVLADNIAPLVDAGFSQHPNSLSAIDVFVLAYLFGFQIYFDFAGYSNIAIGSARLIGVHIPENFNFPYVASSPREFWKRWHISLSSWIKDYVYIPLLGAKSPKTSNGAAAIDSEFDVKQSHRPYLALYLTWSIMGLWHGSSWTFLVWGIFHALLITAYRMASKISYAFPMFVRIYFGWLITMPLIMLAWIPFRAESVAYAFKLYGQLFNFRNYFWMGLRENAYIIAFDLLMAILVSYFLHELKLKRGRFPNLLLIESPIKILIYTITIVMDFIFLRPISQFIYFQF